MKNPEEHINKKKRIIKALSSHPLEWIPIIRAGFTTFLYRYIQRCVGKNSIVGRGTKIINFTNVKIGSNCLIQDYVYMRAGADGRIEIGDHCAINSFAKLFGHGGIEIQEHSQLGPGCLLTTTHHDYIDNLRTEFRKITIGRRVWIGANTIILSGVKIGDSSVIGAGSIVTKEIPPNSIAVGSPAKVIKQI